MQHHTKNATFIMPPRKKDWTISDKIALFAGSKCPDELRLKYCLCTVWDPEVISFSYVKMRNTFWVDYFIDHVKSARHKKTRRKWHAFLSIHKDLKVPFQQEL